MHSEPFSTAEGPHDSKGPDLSLPLASPAGRDVVTSFFSSNIFGSEYKCCDSDLVNTARSEHDCREGEQTVTLQ